MLDKAGMRPAQLTTVAQRSDWLGIAPMRQSSQVSVRTMLRHRHKPKLRDQRSGDNWHWDAGPTVARLALLRAAIGFGDAFRGQLPRLMRGVTVCPTSLLEQVQP